MVGHHLPGSPDGVGDLAIGAVGAPTDEGSPFLPGSRFGPRALREHSLRFVAASPGYFDPNREKVFLQREMRDGLIVDLGDSGYRIPKFVIK